MCGGHEDHFAHTRSAMGGPPVEVVDIDGGASSTVADAAGYDTGLESFPGGMLANGVRVRWSECELEDEPAFRPVRARARSAHI